MIDIKKVSLCLNTKEATYPKEVLDSVIGLGFGEILILCNSDSPHRKYELFEKAKYDLLAYQDDDAIVDWQKIIENYKEGLINVGMKQSHFDSYKDWRMTMGLGWGCFFDRKFLKELNKYIELYGEDEVFKRDTEKLLTHLVYPQNRIVISVRDLPSAMNPDRISMQPGHYSYMEKIVQRCKHLI